MRIAVIGSGISGLGAAWLLHRHHDVHLFERDDRLGGHAHTHTVRTSEGRDIPIDTGFLVYNEPTYPNLTRLFEVLDVPTQASDMSFAVRCERCDVEYAGNGPGLFAQRRNIVRAGHYRLIRDILEFNRLGRRYVDDPVASRVTLGRFLELSGLSDELADHYLLPMAAAIWSSGTGVIRDFPLGTLLRFLDNHGLLGVTTHHPWRTVTGGSREYVQRIAAPLGDRVHLGVGADTIWRGHGGVDIKFTDGSRDRFDAVVLASHADTSLRLLADPTDDEKELLGSWSYSRNETYLHTDESLLPRRPTARASWNYVLDDCTVPAQQVAVSYDLNRLQSLPTDDQYVVTLNPSRPPRSGSVVERIVYTHPVYTPDAVASQAGIQEINGSNRTFFAGAYLRYGFHEDGLWSAVQVARQLGVSFP